MSVSTFGSFARSILVSAAAASLAAAIAGCAEPMTYAQDFKHDGLRQYNLGNYTDAAGSFQAAARQDPTDYQDQYYLGMSLEKTGQIQPAVEAYRLCLKLRVQMPAGRADVAMREKVLARLAPLIASADFADPEIKTIQQEAATDNSIEDYRLLARIYALRGDPDSAVTSYKSGFDANPDDFSLAKEYGLYMLKLDQTAEGTRILKKAWDINPYDRQVSATLRDLGVNESQLLVSNSRIEPGEPLATPQTAWDASVAPKE